MAATLVSPLAADARPRRQDGVRGFSRLSPSIGASATAAVVSAALALLAVAGVAAALLLPRSSSPPQTSLSPASTTPVPALVAHR